MDNDNLFMTKPASALCIRRARLHVYRLEQIPINRAHSLRP